MHPSHIQVTERAELTGQIARALRYIAGGMGVVQAANKAQITVTPALWDFVNGPRYPKELRAACQWRLETKLLPLALAALERALQPDAPLKQQIDAAKIVMDRGGFAPRPYQEVSDGKAITDMSRSELHAFVAAADARLKEATDKLAELATPVNATETKLDIDQAIERLRR